MATHDAREHMSWGGESQLFFSPALKFFQNVPIRIVETALVRILNSITLEGRSAVLALAQGTSIEELNDETGNYHSNTDGLRH